MQPSQRCYDLIKSFEGLQLEAYPDPATNAEPYTIGYGTITYPNGNKVQLGDTITQQEAEEFLEHEVNLKGKAVSALIKEVPINQSQFDALISFVYNLGTGALAESTLLKKIMHNPHDQSIREEFEKWVYANHKKMTGLERRRKTEAELYFS